MHVEPATDRHDDLHSGVHADPVRHLTRLIRCASVTPRDDGALAYLQSTLEAAGFRVDRVVFSAPGTPDIDNLYARYGTSEPCLVFAGHTDVVPAGDAAAWTHPPFAADMRDGVIYGRGAVDMKGGIACMLAAVLDFIAVRPVYPGSIAVLITGDEEGPAINGTVKLLEWARARGERFSHCLLGEPTNVAALGDTIKIGRRGSLNATLVIEGRQGHAAYPHLADNPLRRIGAFVDALYVPLDVGTAHFGPTNLEVVSVDTGNPAFNVIPARAAIRFNVRFNDLWTPDSLTAELRRRCTTVGERDIPARWRLDIEPTNAVAFVTEPGPFVTMAVDAIEACTGRRPALSTTGGTSDARFIKDHCPVIEFGLVGDTMHMVDERVPVADLIGLTAIYREILERYFSNGTAAVPPADLASPAPR